MPRPKPPEDQHKEAVTWLRKARKGEVECKPAQVKAAELEIKKLEETLEANSGGVHLTADDIARIHNEALSRLAEFRRTLNRTGNVPPQPDLLPDQLHLDSKPDPAKDGEMATLAVPPGPS